MYRKTFTRLSFRNIFLITALLSMLLQLASAQTMLTGITSNGGPDGKGTGFTINTNGGGFSLIQSFADWGQTPNGSLLKGDDGYFYGMTNKGGTYNYGSIFKMSAAGGVTVLRELSYNTDGGYPDGELIRGADGLYYGMTVSGGLNGYGTIFKISASGAYTVIRNLSSADGANPHGHLTLGSDGNYYGISYRGGVNGYGAIFKLAPDGTYTILHSLDYTADGGYSYSSLTEGKDGNLYGVTYSDGTNYSGTIFKVTKSGAYTVLRYLKPADGVNPECDLIQATDGNFYGTCYKGGSNGVGTIFKITPAGIYTVIRNLAYATDGGYPYGSLLQHSDGLLYGMMTAGGANGAGTVYKLTLAGGYTVLHSLQPATEGSTPNGALVAGNDGAFYALASYGGVYDMGTAFKVTTAGAVTLLANLNGAAIGDAPQNSFIKGKDSAYYCTTSDGGAFGYGSIIKICGGSTSVLFSFNKSLNGATPKGNLLQASDGNFYGTTTEGGTNGGGTIFKITPAGSFTVLRHLSGSKDGSGPSGSLIQATDGFLYGTCTYGGTGAAGTLFKISTGGAYTVVRNLSYTTDGNSPLGDLLQASDGNFYGMTSNNAKIFKLAPDGTFTVAYSFSSSKDGAIPCGSLIQGSDGNLYGTCSDGGVNGYGTIFQFSLSGTYKVLKALLSATDGRAPKGSLVQGADGMLYGTTSIGGTYNTGTVFKLSTAGAYTVLRHLNITTDGGKPLGSLVFAPVNNLVANAQSVVTSQDNAVAITLTGSGGSQLNYTISVQPKNGVVTGNGAGRIYTPNAGFSGKDSFYFRVNTGCISSAAAKVSITVNAVATANHAPVLDTIINKNIKQNSTLKFKATAADPDTGQTVTFSLVSAPAGATINASTGAFAWTPTAAGTYSATIRVTDNGTPAMYDQQTFNIKVNAVAAGAINTTANNSEAAVKALPGQLFNVSLYPNPVHNSCTIKLNTSTAAVAITIKDAKGSVVINKQVNMQGALSTVLDVASLAAGTYFLTVRNEHTMQTVKFIKQ